MAYIKSHTTKSGVEGNYWRITDLKLNKIQNTLLVVFSLYISKAVKQSGKEPLVLSAKSFVVPLSLIDTTKDILEEAYKATKTANERDFQNPLMQGEAYFADATID